MNLETLYVHRVEPVQRNGQTRLEPLPEKPEECNLGIKYKLQVQVESERHAVCYGWFTGYVGCGGSGDTVSKPEAYVHAPKGFGHGELVFVKAIDPLLGVSTRAGSSIDDFLKDLENTEVHRAIDALQGFTLVGIITNISNIAKQRN